MPTNAHTHLHVRRAALLWAQLRLCAPSAYMDARSLRDACRRVRQEQRLLLIRPGDDAAAILRWRRLGLLIQAIDAHTRPGASRRGLLEV